MALPAESGVIMHGSPCQPRSAIFATATAMPALIFSALKPGGSEGSEKSTVSGFCPTKRMLIISVSPSSVCSWLPEAKGYVAQKETHTVDYRDADGLRVRQRVEQTVRYLER